MKYSCHNINIYTGLPGFFICWPHWLTFWCCFLINALEIQLFINVNFCLNVPLFQVLTWVKKCQNQGLVELVWVCWELFGDSLYSHDANKIPWRLNFGLVLTHSLFFRWNACLHKCDVLFNLILVIEINSFEIKSARKIQKNLYYTKARIHFEAAVFTF